MTIRILRSRIPFRSLAHRPLMGCVCSLVCLALAGSLSASVQVIPTAGRNIWSVAVGRLDGPGKPAAIVGGSFDGRVCAFTAEGAHLWDAPTGAFIFNLLCADLDGDGRDEVLAGSADGKVHVLDASGHPLWNYDQVVPIASLAVARLDGRTPVVLVGGATRKIAILSGQGRLLGERDVEHFPVMLRAGDFDGDGADEVLVLTLVASPPNTKYTATLLKGPRLDQQLWQRRKDTEVFVTRNHGYDLAVVATADGKARLASHRSLIALDPAGARTIATLKPANFPAENTDFHYRQPLVAAGRMLDQVGVQVIVLHGPDVGLWQEDGQLLASIRLDQGFTDVAYLPGENGQPGSAIFGSSPNGDDALYRVSFGPGWTKELKALKPQGRIAEVNGNIDQLKQQIARWKGKPIDGRGRIHTVMIEGGQLNDPKRVEGLTWIPSTLADYQKRFGQPNVRFATNLWMATPPLRRTDGKPWARDPRLGPGISRAQLVAFAARMERDRAAFWAVVGHGCGPFIDLETAKAILAAAPTTCLGFNVSEDSQPERLVDFLDQWLLPLMDQLPADGSKKVVMLEKQGWWAVVAAMPEIRDRLFASRYRKILVPTVEDSNCRAPDLNVAGRIGLWRSGLVENWCSRMIADHFCFIRNEDREYVMNGHPHLRHMVAQAAAGASDFHFVFGQRNRTGGGWTIEGEQAMAPFLDMLGKGIIAPPTPEEVCGLSPVALEIRNPSVRLVKTCTNFHSNVNYQADAGRYPMSKLDGYWGMATTPDYDLGAILWGRRRQAFNFLPATPWGLVAVVPANIPRADSWKIIWSTDGDRLWREGEEVPPVAAFARLRADLIEQAKRLPVALTGDSVHAAIQRVEDWYLLTLVDPGWVDPAKRHVRIVANLPGRWRAADRLRGVNLTKSLDGAWELDVPAGTLRLIEIHPD